MAKVEPYPDFNNTRRNEAIRNNRRNDLPDYYSDSLELRQIVNDLLIVDTTRRPTIE